MICLCTHIGELGDARDAGVLDVHTGATSLDELGTYVVSGRCKLYID